MSAIAPAMALLLLSIILCQEGAFRLVAAASSSLVGGGFPWQLLLAAAVLELVMGIVGVLLCGVVLLSKESNNRTYVVVTLVVQHVTGWFFFIVFAIAQPAYGISQTATTDIERAQGVFSLFYGMATCFSLQGGAILFGFQLLALADGKSLDRDYYMSRFRTYAISCIFGSFWYFVYGCIASAYFGSGPAPLHPPIFPARPPQTIVLGISVLVVSVVNMIVSFSKGEIGDSMRTILIWVNVLLWIWFIFFGLVTSLALLGLAGAPTGVLVGVESVWLLLPLYLFIMATTTN